MRNFNLDRVILVLSDNLLYEGFWEYSSKFWKNKFGVQPTLFFYGDQKNIKIDRTIGEIYDLPFIEETCVNKNRDWACTWGLFYGASLFENDICMTCGIDQAPLSDSFFKSINHYNYDLDYVVGLSEAYNNNNWYVSSHHVAKGKIFKKALNIDDNWENELIKVFSQRFNYGQMYGGNDFWGLDELHSSNILNNYEHLKRHRGFYQYLYNNRIDRGYNLNVNIEKLKNGEYSELHSPRPYKKHIDFLEQIYNLTPSFL
jgi:hypothetical protein